MPRFDISNPRKHFLIEKQGGVKGNWKLVGGWVHKSKSGVEGGLPRNHKAGGGPKIRQFSPPKFVNGIAVLKYQMHAISLYLCIDVY